MAKLISLEFEVFGKVQGVFFRKHTEREAQRLGLKGWCRNTSKGTVTGVLEGDATRVDDMKMWLQHTGSPSSVIEKADFKNERSITNFHYNSFNIKK